MIRPSVSFPALTPRPDDATPIRLSPTREEIRASEQARRASVARHTSGRRRFVDPATCERDYDASEMEFMSAMQEYKRTSGRMFPTWSEVLEVVRDLGYEKVNA